MSITDGDNPGFQPFLPRYEVLESLGEGGAATVCKVRTTWDGSVYALKALRPERAEQPTQVRRFEDEFRILRRLHHPHLPEVYDYGFADDDTCYMVMELVEGEPLDEYFETHKDDLWFIIFQLTEALAFIHDHDLLHLDLKPGNVLVKRTRAFGAEEHPLVKLIDFGLSYQRREGREVKMVGTAHYMSPDIIRGDDRLTRAADYYSLGAILYQLVEGHPAFDGDLDDILRAHLSEPVRFGQRRVEYAELYPVVEKLMSKEVNERLEAFQEFRRMVSARMGDAVEPIERAYAAAHIESLGPIGKDEIWQEIERWSESLRSPHSEDGGRHEAGVRSQEQPLEDEPDAAPVDDDPDIATRIEKELLATASSGQEGNAHKPGAPERSPRYLTVTGPTGSGKTFLVDVLRGHLLPTGVQVVALGDRTFYESLTRHATVTDAGEGPGVSGASAHHDPGSAQVDRFVSAWESLSSMGRRSGVVVVVDDLRHLDPERREFLEYVIKRIELLTSEDREPGVFMTITDRGREDRTLLNQLNVTDPDVFHLEVPPPTSDDVEHVIGRFHGAMTGTEDRHALTEYLRSGLDRAGTLVTGLRNALTVEALTYHHGRWSFRRTRDLERDRRRDLGEYYDELLRDLPTVSRELLVWLSSHPGELSLERLEVVSKLSPRDVFEAAEHLRPYRLLAVDRTPQRISLRFVSDDIREAFYQVVEPARREQCHRAFIDHYRQQDSEGVAGLEAHAYHCRHAGEPREALVLNIRALRAWREQDDVYNARRLCETSIDTVGELGEPYHEARRRHIERFFIKSLIDIEWLRNNYGGVIDLVREYFESRERPVPVGLIPRYASSLESAGRRERCAEVIEEAKSRLGERRLETWQHLLLIDANRLHSSGKNEEALAVLQEIDAGRLPWTALSKYYVMLMLCHDTLGHFDEGGRFAGLAEETATERARYEDLLRVFYHRVQSHIRNGKYSEARSEIRKSLRIASRHKVYRSLCTMYFMATTVYYEEGDYDQALKFMERAIRLGADIGAYEHVDAYTVRSSLIYRNLGRYGNAIHLLDSVRRRVPPTSGHYFFAGLILLDIYTSIYNPRAETYVQELLSLSEDQTRHSQALFHQLIGDYKHLTGRHLEALDDYSTALRLYKQARVHDDAVRTLISEARSWLELGRLDEALRLATELDDAVRDLESQEVRALYVTLLLELRMAEDDSVEKITPVVAELEAYLEQPKDVRVQLRMVERLFFAHIAMGKRVAALRYFDLYYQITKQICSNLSDGNLIEKYVRNPRFSRALKAVRTLQKENPR